MLDFLQFISDYNGEDRFMTRIGVGGLINMDKLKQTHHVLNDIALFHHHAKQQIETVTSRSVRQVVSLSKALLLLFILSLLESPFLNCPSVLHFKERNFKKCFAQLVCYSIWAMWQRTLKNVSKCVKFGTKSTHFEKKFQSVLNLRPI